ncbi:hypothetical protein GALL_69040 [mine drainage metagenome]|uniref:Quinol:cytochrome c oxidoreductase quinone-binding subunit 2 n=1 Tax=mine drainage metagenome TaxID=410659 RepID=A0A1J5STU8_9ZZZZ
MLSYSNWSVLTASFVVVTYLALSGVALCSVLYLVGAKWRLQIGQLGVSLYSLFPLAFVLLVILLIGGEHTFPWIGHVSHGENVHMPGWYTLPLLAAREVIGMLTVMFVWRIFIKRQAVMDRSEEDRAKFHHVACWVPFFTVLYATMVAWDFEMTLKPSWHSAIYGMQNLVSNFGMFLSFLVIWIYVLNTRNRLVKRVDEFIYNYLAQMMLAFTLLWMYTFFAQYLTIWYGNLGDERDRIDGMQNGDFSALWWTMIALKFVIPFASLCFPVTRHNPKATVVIAAGIIVGTLLERFVWIAGVNGTGTIPVLWGGLVSIGVIMVGYQLVRSTMVRNQLIKG